jgi:hypothetical protein
LRKTPHASEQGREDARQAREAWIQAQPFLEATPLEFIGETGMTARMTRRYGRSLKGKRCVASALRGHRKTNAFIAASGNDALPASLIIGWKGIQGLRGTVPAAWRDRHRRQPFLPQDCRHRGSDEAAGATLFYLPPYSPVLNPIEKVFSKRKTLLRGLAPRTKDSLWDNLGALLNPFSPQKCKNHFASCEYVIA